jgi:hypothetical protein
MKTIITLACALILGGGLSTTAFAAKRTFTANTSTTNSVTCSTNRPAGTNSWSARTGRTNSSSAHSSAPFNHGSLTNAVGSCTNRPTNVNTNAAADLASRAATLYAAVVAFDTGADGALNATEQIALAAALTNGTVAIFGTNTACVIPARDAANVAAWITAVYAQIATFDTDRSGALDATEQTALAAVLEADTVSLPLFAPLMLHHGHHASRTLPTTLWLLAKINTDAHHANRIS